jgi:S-adenosylmethionine decarboxylase
VHDCGLDRKKASVFFKTSADGGGHVSCAKEMTKPSGISDIIPEMDICGFDFEPCRYSMNAIHGPAFSTIHVTHLRMVSAMLASYEVMGLNPASSAYGGLVKRVLKCFGPSEFSVAVTIFGERDSAKTCGRKLDAESYACSGMVEQELPSGGLFVYQSFTATGEVAVGSPRSVIHSFSDDAGGR